MDQFYYVFGFTLMVYLILIVTCAEATVLLVYYQLCAEKSPVVVVCFLFLWQHGRSQLHLLDLLVSNARGESHAHDLPALLWIHVLD